MASPNPLTFPSSRLPFSLEEFRQPRSEYHGLPFWSWNTKLSAPRLLDQLRYMKEEMGMGGAHMHPRSGLDTEYMGKEFLDVMDKCVKWCKEHDMLACLYDEDRWPSGAAGGAVSKAEPAFRQMHLLLTRYPYGHLPEGMKFKNPPKGMTLRTENGTLLGRFNIRHDGDCISYTPLREEEEGTAETVWFYAEYQPPDPWWNYGSYIDTLNPEAVKLFLKLTHERYLERFGPDFGTVIPSIFTDEPQFTAKEFLQDARSRCDVFLPWTADLPDAFAEAYGTSLIDHLPELIWDTREVSLTRYRYHDILADHFVSAYIQQIAQWCGSHGISLTGHVNGEPRLLTQTQSVGDAMRCYQHFDIPGIDMLCDAREYNTVKQASSVARQRGISGVLCEMYGVTNWTFDFTGHKGQGDWQAALGVTIRVPHLFPVSIAGESKRDYPAAIGPQSPWTKEYAYIESHFARVNSILTRGKPICRVGVIHPIESFWLSWGPADQSGAEQVWREHAFEQLTEWLLHGLVDFDFICEALLPNQCALEDINTTFPVGEMRYSVIIVPNLRTIRSTTVERLKRFEQLGGVVLVTGGLPELIDVRPAAPVFGKPVNFTEWDILNELEPQRDLRVLYRGTNAQSLFCQLRQDGDQRFLFICDTARFDPISTTVKIRGEWDCEVLDTLPGTSWRIASDVTDGWTVFPYTFHSSSSLLLRLEKRTDAHRTAQIDYEDGFQQIKAVEFDSVHLSEPNVLLLDYARWRLASMQDWEPIEEVLRIDNLARARLGMPQKKDAFPQPWSLSAAEREPKDTLLLSFDFETQVDLDGCKLALENLGGSTVVSMDGETLGVLVDGWWVDPDIPTAPLPLIKAGKHVLQIGIPMGVTTPIERVYILGDFSVQLYGARSVLEVPNTDRLSWGDYTRQGLPFYAGDITYHAHFDLDTAEHVVLQTHQLFGPAATLMHYPPSEATAPFGTKHHLSLPPHLADIGTCQPGRHRIEVTLFGNRQNAFGAIHMPRGATDWWNPNSFRGEQHFWTDEYNIEEMGMSAIVVRVPGKRSLAVPIRRRHVEQAGFYGHGR